MRDPDLEIREGAVIQTLRKGGQGGKGGGGGLGGNLFGPQFGLKLGGERGAQLPPLDLPLLHTS